MVVGPSATDRSHFFIFANKIESVQQDMIKGNSYVTFSQIEPSIGVMLNVVQLSMHEKV